MLRSRRPPSRTASSGDTREARIAGITAEATVTNKPTITTTTIVRGMICSGPSGNVPSPALSNSNFSSAAMPMPPNRPTIDAITPMISDSTRTMPRICGPLAPIERNRPSCLVRWPTRIANVL